MRLSPLTENSPLDASEAAEYRRRYLGMCQQLSPQAVVGMLVCTAYVYLVLWLLPVSKALAASLTLALLAWLPVHALWRFRLITF